MIIPDINLLVYSYNSDAPNHARAKEWWEEVMSAGKIVGIPWVVILGFVRLTTNRKVMLNPISSEQAFEIVQDWLNRSNVTIISAGPRYIPILSDYFKTLGVTGNLVTDAHLAALALENQAEIHSNDCDFARFGGIRWVNPLK